MSDVEKALDVLVRALKFELGDNLHRTPWKGWIANAESALATARPQPTENDVEAAGQVTAKYKNGVWANFDVYWSEMETDIAAALAQAREDTERLRGGLKLCIGMHTGTPWPEVSDADVEGYCNRWFELAAQKEVSGE